MKPSPSVRLACASLGHLWRYADILKKNNVLSTDHSPSAAPRGGTRLTCPPILNAKGIITSNIWRFSSFFSTFFLNVSMPFLKMKWPKSEEKPKLGLGGICHGQAFPQCTDPVPPMSNSWCTPVSHPCTFLESAQCHPSNGVCDVFQHEVAFRRTVL